MPHRSIIVVWAALCLWDPAHGQERKATAGLWAGTIVAGYADGGAYLNCVGPNIKYAHGSWSVALGLLPTIRIKKDRVAAGQSRNSVFTPTLGTGLTMGWKRLAWQVPLFYQPKTATANGRWMPGVGLGWQL